MISDVSGGKKSISIIPKDGEFDCLQRFLKCGNVIKFIEEICYNDCKKKKMMKTFKR